MLSRLPEYFKHHGFQNPDDGYNGPFQFAMDTNLHFFDFLQRNPKQQQAFNSLIGTSRTNRGEEWFNLYPVEERLRVSEVETLLVDIGSGLSHDLVAFKQRFPDLPGKLVAQNLPTVINGVKDLPLGIEAMGHDFFNPQPIKNARAYFLLKALHNWSEKQARDILSNIKARHDRAIDLVSR